MPDKQPTDKRPITLDDINDIDYIDAYKKIEVVDGDWNQPHVPFYRSHGMLAGIVHMNIFMQLFPFTEANEELGQVYTGSVGYVMEGSRDNIQLMRRADITFVRRDRVLKANQHEPYYCAPDLAVEVLFEDFATDLLRRIHDYLSHGTAQVWVVYPVMQQIHVYLPEDKIQIYRPGDTIDANDLLPGFSLDVTTVFEV